MMLEMLTENFYFQTISYIFLSDFDGLEYFVIEKGLKHNSVTHIRFYKIKT